MQASALPAMSTSEFIATLSNASRASSMKGEVAQRTSASTEDAHIVSRANSGTRAARSFCTSASYGSSVGCAAVAAVAACVAPAGAPDPYATPLRALVYPARKEVGGVEPSLLMLRAVSPPELAVAAAREPRQRNFFAAAFLDPQQRAQLGWRRDDAACALDIRGAHATAGSDQYHGLPADVRAQRAVGYQQLHLVGQL